MEIWDERWEAIVEETHRLLGTVVWAKVPTTGAGRAVQGAVITGVRPACDLQAGQPLTLRSEREGQDGAGSCNT